MFFNKVRFFLKDLKWSFVLYFEKEKHKADCGHMTKARNWIKAFGAKTITKLPLKDGKTAYCHQCLQRMVIQCAWCKKPIFVGDPITLYSPRDPNFKVPEHAVIYSENPLCLVGCLGWNCAVTGADRAGFWLPPGQVQRVVTPLEMIMANPSQGVMIVSDLSDIKEAVQL